MQQKSKKFPSAPCAEEVCGFRYFMRLLNKRGARLGLTGRVYYSCDV